ncbi:MAG: phosphate/phosphite/phosphonate ABC transporter substrate-binding protein [Candidatus Thiodiazotropha sp. (ex Ctena orbiculata)]|nr:phosphate/phosphite/phosphonate ABC transporter substrate-binding protein [Candidatus Thiodiazotropha taylori]MBT2995313.1 phosphate/phosphite/phosphonate ABC transporter substrate-binding protein [Candidatus Thiodiazotropha taylori]MBT3001773.1 phosphate/phosphite/phosphonate ABC transporter substrate-binding protein [Candidatus Thiodiazotropha taylori]MBV2108331.1 phosphate/phosphite/phosphonate ABC transporter substrate-binding protein [Candidatus Thiodiazotropha taylori]MBV2109455.1 phos
MKLSKKSDLFFPIVLLSFFVFTTLLPSIVKGAEERVAYTFGVVPKFEQRKLFKIWRPILDELEMRTGFSFELVGSPKIPVFEKKYMEGEYDFAYMNPYHILKANDSQGYLPLVRDGGRVLKGILVVRKDNPIKSVQDLSGKQIAFPAPNALGASLLMRADLAQLHHIKAIPLYVQTHSSVYLHVVMGMAEAGGGVASTLASQKPEIRDRLRILYETRPMSPHPVSVHPRVPNEDQEKVRHAFLELAQTEKGAALLSKIPMRKAISANMDDYEPMLSWGLEDFYVNN